MTKHLNIRVSGKVQGVFFRASTKERADLLGIKGFVRNEGDGSVYIEAEGEETELNQFTDWCRKGPELARVEHCLVTEAPAIHFKKFEITR